MDPNRLSARLAAALLAATSGLLLAACAETVPPRPVPQPEAKPELPGWFPEKPWTEQRNDRVYLEGKIVFDTAKWTIRPESDRVLKQLLEYLQSNPDISRIRLEGHTDERGSDEYNQGLSEHRATAVSDWLVDHGLDSMRVLAVAFGETRPLRTNATPEGRQENRRTEFHVAEVGGTRFMGRDPTNGGLVIEILSKEDRERAKEVGKVPTYVEPPWTPTRDIIAPINELEKPQGSAPGGAPPSPPQKKGEPSKGGDAPAPAPSPAPSSTPTPSPGSGG
jgi:outer membrane protein OmpA-like peptidoglycan-associated protein